MIQELWGGGNCWHDNGGLHVGMVICGAGFRLVGCYGGVGVGGTGSCDDVVLWLHC